jgi:hypothetical protein
VSCLKRPMCTGSSPVTFFFLHILVKYKPMNVPQPPQSEVEELAHRVLCIIELCKDIIVRARRTLAERAGRDPDKEIASANAMLSIAPTLRQALPATTGSGASNRGVHVRGTSGDLLNPLKRDHDSMVSGMAVSLVLRPSGLVSRYIALPPSLAPWHFVLSLPHRSAILPFRAPPWHLTPTHHGLHTHPRRVLLSRVSKRLKWSSSGTRGWPPNLASRVNIPNAMSVLFSRPNRFG